MPYSSSLTDAEWELLEPLLVEIKPQKKRTRPSNWTKREILDGIFYQLKNGCNWEDLPLDLPPYSTVYWHLHSVARSGVNREAYECVTWTSASRREKNVKWTTSIIIDSQAVQNTCNASVETKGFCFYKLTNGIRCNPLKNNPAVNKDPAILTDNLQHTAGLFFRPGNCWHQTTFSSGYLGLSVLHSLQPCQCH